MANSPPWLGFVVVCFVLFALLAQASFLDYLVREHDFDVDCPSKDASGRRGQTATEMVCAV